MVSGREGRQTNSMRTTNLCVNFVTTFSEVKIIPFIGPIKV